MICRRSEKKFWMRSLLLAGFMLFALSDMGFVAQSEAFAETQAPIENDKATSISGNQNEAFLPIILPSTLGIAHIKVPQPEGFVLAESDIKKNYRMSKLTYTSNLDVWKKQKNKQPYTGYQVILAVLGLGEKNTSNTVAQENQELFDIFLGKDIVFFGNMQDIYMGHGHLKNPDRAGVGLFGFTRIDTAQIGLFISLPGEAWSNDEFERCKKIMEDYFLALRAANPTPLKIDRPQPRKKVCAIPGGKAVTADGETIVTFKDCRPMSIFPKKVPLPNGFKIVQESDQRAFISKLMFASDIETWKKYEAKKPGEPFNDNLVTFSLRKYRFESAQEARDNLIEPLTEADGLKTFGDLPETYMAYIVYPSSCDIEVRASTKILDDSVDIFLQVYRPCSPDALGAEVYKKMMIDYIQRVRAINMQ